ncbi:MAG: NUDIX hydrolase [Pseudomonadota bacterium]
MKRRSMSHVRVHQLPLSISASAKRESRSQFAALPFRVVDGNVQILLVTSRRTKRWILPKGWPEDGMTPGECAAREAWEEGGVEGKGYDICLGVYSFEKFVKGAPDLPVMGLVFPLRVKKVHRTWPEAKERGRAWFSPKKAASAVDMPELKRILKTFDPKLIKALRQ